MRGIVNENFVSSFYQLQPGEIDSVLGRLGLYTRLASGGSEIVVKDCPLCDKRGQPVAGKATNQWKLHFRSDSGAFNCVRCKSHGSWYEFKKEMGMLPQIEQMGGRKMYRRPNQEIANSYPAALQAFPEVAEYLTTKRKIKKETLEMYLVGATLYSFQNEEEDWVESPCVTFPWMDYGTTGWSIVRVKARSLARKEWMRLDPSQGEWGFFGWHTIPQNAAEIVVTEGEYDAMSVWQETGVPAISLPNGSNSLPPELIQKLERFRTIYLWLDDDAPGQSAMQSFAEKLGIARVKLVYTRQGQIEGPKDANDALCSGHSLKRILLAAKPLLHKEILELKDVRDEVVREILNYDEVKGIPFDAFPKLTEILGGFREGELTIFTGGTGTGKTTVLTQLTLGLALRGVRHAWGSFEIKNHKLVKSMFYKFAGKPLHYDQHKREIDSAWEKFVEIPVWLMKFFGSTNLDKIIDAMDYCVYALDIKHFVLDNLQFMTSGQGKGFEKFDIQDNAIDRLRKFATDKRVHISIVIHPKKTTEGLEMDVSNIGGTAKASQEADNVIVLQKGPYYRYLDVRKNRESGDTGAVPYEYDKATTRLLPLSEQRIQELQESGSTETQGESHGMASQVAKYRPKGPTYAPRKKAAPADPFPFQPYQNAPAETQPQKPRHQIKNYAPGAQNSWHERDR